PGHFRHELLNAVTVKDTTGRIELLRDGFVHLGGYATAAGHRDTPDIGRRQSRHHVAGSLLQRGLFPVNRTGNAVRDSASEPDNGGQLLLQTSEQTSHDRLTSSYQQDAVVREGTLNGLNLRSDARGETNHVRSEEHTSELQSREKIVCRLLLEKKDDTNAGVEATNIRSET